MSNQFCPACGINLRDGVFFASRVVRNSDNSIQVDEDSNTVRVYDVPFTPTVQRSRICQYSKQEGCINTCKQITPSETFEARSQGLSVDSWYETAKELLKHD
jgi:hypothetical protein